ncbi:ferredoxin [Amycolatopsis arida]|uniref:Ferredoxin n=1 Tax=Amycolatopsis arida TaxID=587909 RepID=A0A1I5P2I8_9PSEU|nr:ferredoxin [Amycolatopsis arida]SFP28275.1 ferredoxin [Amycolatopsis arida]
MWLRIEADTGRCAGAGMCALVGPALFDQTDDDGTVVILRRVVSGEAAELAVECAGNCPTGAISVRPVEEGSSAQVCHAPADPGA